MSRRSTSLEPVVRRDLAPFVDPETEIAVTETASALAVEWTQGNRGRQAAFRRAADDVLVVEDGHEMRYRAFFAGSSMADLDALAQGTIRLHRSSEPFVEGRARISGIDGAAQDSPALQTLLQAVGHPADSEATRMVFLRADAGVGKTTSLRQLCLSTAERLLRREASSLFLFIDAQGRGLRRLDEAIAVALDDLRHPLTYHAVPTLTRLGLLIPVIDGFDELIGASGTFDAAFDSLSAFVERLEGEGVFLASARSAYYEREFVARVDRDADRETAAWEELGVELLPWGDREIDEYLARHEPEFHSRGHTLEEMRTHFENLFSGPSATLSGKPFFVSRALELLLEGEELQADPSGDLLTLLVDQYLRREADKLLTPETAAPVATPTQLADLLAEVASLMWTLETRELEPDDVEEVAELFAELWELPVGAARLLKEKSTSLAFLMRSPSQRVGFEHPLFFGFFLAARFPRPSTDNGTPGPEMSVMLGRSALPEGAGPAIAQALLGGRGEDEAFSQKLQAAVRVLAEAVHGAPATTARARENAGHLVAGMLRFAHDTGGIPTGLALESLTFAGDDLSALTASGLRLTDVEFRRADLRGARLEGRSDGAVAMTDCLFDEDSRAAFSGEPVALVSAIDGGRELHRPADLDALAVRVQLRRPADQPEPEEWQVDGDLLDRIDKVARHYRRANMLFSNDDYVGDLVTDDRGQAMMRALLGAGVVRGEPRSKSGPAGEVYRLLVSSEDLARSLSGPAEDLDPRLMTAWRALEAEFPRG